MDNKISVTAGIVLVLIGVCLVAVCPSSCYIVDAGESAVILQMGAVKSVQGPGFHMKIPFPIQNVEKMEIRVRKHVTDSTASSHDLQVVHSQIALNYALDPQKVGEIYAGIGHNWEERIIDPAVQEVFKSVTAAYPAEQLITKRPEVSEAIQVMLTERLVGYGLNVREISITDFDFSDEFNKAIESKVTAEQLKLKADRDLERIKVEKEQTITMAQAQAEALRIQKQEVTAELLQLRAIEKWNGVLPNVTGGAVPFIDVANAGRKP